MIKDIVDSWFNLIIDESTDISTVKYLGIIIKYHSKVDSKIITTFLTFAEIHQFDAKLMVELIKRVLMDFELPISNTVGLGTDNALVMVGVNNGVYQTLKLNIPRLILIPSVCHSLQ